MVGPAGDGLACSKHKLTDHKKIRRKDNRARFFTPCDTDAEAPSCLCVDEKPYLEDVFEKNPQIEQIFKKTKTKFRWHQVALAKDFDHFSKIDFSLLLSQVVLFAVLMIAACTFRLTSCYIDNSNDYELHDTTFGDGANLYQLDSIDRCLSETEIGNLIHEFGVASANVLNPTHLTGCGDHGAELERAFDSRAWDVFAREELVVKIHGKLYTIIKTGIGGDMKFLWMIMGNINNYAIRSLGSGPFSVEACHETISNGHIKNWMPIVFTTHFKQSLVNSAQLLQDAIADPSNSRQVVEAATAAYSKLDNFVTTELKLKLTALSRVKFGWDRVDYGQLHEAGTAGMRYLDQLVRMWASMGLLSVMMTLIHNSLVGRVEVRMKTHRVKVPTVGVSATQGEVIKLCSTSLPTLSGAKHYLWMDANERAEALEDADQV